VAATYGVHCLAAEQVASGATLTYVFIGMALAWAPRGDGQGPPAGLALITERTAIA
jgi:hypothetical protein